MNRCGVWLMVALAVSLSGAIALPTTSGQMAIAQPAPETTTQSDAAALLEEGDRLLREGIQQEKLEQTFQYWLDAFSLYRNPIVRDTFPQESYRGASQALDNFGHISFGIGEYQNAIEIFELRLSITREVGDDFGEGITLNNLGYAHSGLSQYQQALEFHRQSFAIAREIGNQELTGGALNGLGGVHTTLGQPQQAIEYLQQGLYIARDIHDRDLETAILNNLGDTHRYIGQYQQAIGFYMDSLSIKQSSGYRTIQSELVNLGSTHFFLAEYQEAVNFLERGLNLAREFHDKKGEAIALNSLGIVYIELGKYEQAIDLLGQSLAIARDIDNRNDEMHALANLANAYLANNQMQKGLETYGQAVAIAFDIATPQSQAVVLNNFGILLSLAKQFDLAQESLVAAIALFEDLRVNLPDAQLISIIDTQLQAYKNLQFTLISQDKNYEALAISERGRAQGFATQLIRRRRQTSEIPTVPTIKPPTLEQIQQIARDTNTILVEYAFFLNNLYIWVVQPSGEIEFRPVELDGNGDTNAIALSTLDGPLYRSVPEPSELDTLVADIRTATLEVVRTGPTAQTSDKLKELHQLLIDPIADLLPTDPDAKVAFIPQGSLFHVPFPALQDDDGTYLIEKHTILTAPSIQVLGLAHDTAQERGTQSLTTNPLIVGNPTMPEVTLSTPSGFVTNHLSPLPGAEEEAIAIATALNTTALTHHQATEATVKQQLPTASLIHLATHGLLDYGESPLDIPGAIALAPSQNGDVLSSTNTEDGLLTSGEIIDMDLQAELAILSACDTGLGTITGDGVVGLSRALITAGVPSVVVSLWSVPDAPTAELMKEFYAQLEQGQSKAQALRQAMLTTMQSHPDPRNWAAFTLIGESK
ncbi:MAG: CHAT domain-containing protein [Cyanobacteria bacterium P01_F01_bin.150]